jgi:hypothetical protein
MQGFERWDCSYRGSRPKGFQIRCATMTMAPTAAMIAAFEGIGRFKGDPAVVG